MRYHRGSSSNSFVSLISDSYLKFRSWRRVTRSVFLRDFCRQSYRPPTYIYFPSWLSTSRLHLGLMYDAEGSCQQHSLLWLTGLSNLRVFLSAMPCSPQPTSLVVILCQVYSFPHRESLIVRNKSPKSPLLPTMPWCPEPTNFSNGSMPNIFFQWSKFLLSFSSCG